MDNEQKKSSMNGSFPLKEVFTKAYTFHEPEVDDKIIEISHQDISLILKIANDFGMAGAFCRDWRIINQEIDNKKVILFRFVGDEKIVMKNIDDVSLISNIIKSQLKSQVEDNQQIDDKGKNSETDKS